MSSFYYSDINLFLIDYACCKLCNVQLLFFESNVRSYHDTGDSNWRKNIVAVVTLDRVIDDNLKKQIKNRTLCTCRLFLLTQIFQYISNLSKVFEHLPNLFLQNTESNYFSKFFQTINFSVHYGGLYRNWANTSLFIIPGALPTLKLPIKNHPLSRQLDFSDVFLVLNYKLSNYKYQNTILYDIYYLQNYKAMAMDQRINVCNKSMHFLVM